MTDDASERGAPRATAERPAVEGKSTQSDRDAEARAVRDNMARLKALRLAREAAEPQHAAAKKITRAKPGQKTKPAGKSAANSSKSDNKPQALSDWLASQQTGGRRI